MFLIVAFVLLLFVPTPWNVLAFLLALVAFGGEVYFWNRRVRGKRARVGVETLVGEKATVVIACRPRGQVRVGGELWEARCDEGADAGDEVVVTAVQELVLVVVPAH